MIRVVITGPATNGRFPFRVETEGTRLAHSVTGLSAVPLHDACKMLKTMGAAEDTAKVGLFLLSDMLERANVTVGSVVAEAEVPATRLDFVPYQRTVIEVIERDELNDDSIATPEEAPPPPRKLRGRPAGKGRAASAPDTPTRSHRKRKPAGSGGRQGRR